MFFVFIYLHIYLKQITASGKIGTASQKLPDLKKAFKKPQNITHHRRTMSEDKQSDRAEIARQKLLNYINAKRKRSSGPNRNPINSPATSPTDTEAQLTRYHFHRQFGLQSIYHFFFGRRAIDEINKESSDGAVRASVAGPSGWQRAPHLDQGNKRLLRNTIRSAIAHNRRRADPTCGGAGVKRKIESELDAIIAGGKQRQPKFGTRKHCFRKVDKSKEPDKK